MTDPRIIFPRAPDSPLYFQRYVKFILSRPKRDLSREDGFHIHHIVPKCVGGPNDPDNLIKLTYREHYLCHALLAIAFRSHGKIGSTLTFFRKSAKNSRLYETLLLNGLSEFAEEQREIRAERCRNRVWSDESREKLRRNALANPTIHFALGVANSRDRTGIKNPRANKEVWEQEEYLKKVWLENNKCGARRLFSLTKIGGSWQSLKTILNKFRGDDDIV